MWWKLRICEVVMVLIVNKLNFKGRVKIIILGLSMVELSSGIIINIVSNSMLVLLSFFC